MIDVDLDAIANAYRNMSEDGLMDVARHYESLIEGAQERLRAEFARRGLEPPVIEEAEPEPDVAAALVTVARYRDLPEALVARSVLEQAGIACFLRDENTVRMDWAISNLIGGMRLTVMPQDIEAAEAVLKQPIPPTFAVDSGEDYVQPVCPHCGSVDVSTDNRDQKWAVAGQIASGVLLPVALPAMAMQPDGVWKCNVCGTRWQGEEEDDAAGDTGGEAAETVD